jgi:putative ABC transport system ATP-binding protein
MSQALSASSDSAAPGAAVSIDHVRYAWPGKPTLLDIERLSIARGERVFLRGPSGSGKSTLLGLVGGVLTPAVGRIEVLGQDLAQLGASERDRFRGDHIGFVFQMFNLIPYLSVLENVLLSARFSTRRAARAARRGTPGAEAARLLTALGLGDMDVHARGVTELSIGQQQRVAAARALLGAPEILIADEPTSALDHDSRRQFLELLMAECREQGSTLVFVSHDTTLGSLFDRDLSLLDLNRAARLAA